MFYIVRIMNGTFNSAEDFKSKQLWTIINEVQEPLDFDIDVIHNPSLNQVAITMSGSDVDTLKNINSTQFDEVVRQRAQTEIEGHRYRNVASILTFTTTDSFNEWKATFTA